MIKSKSIHFESQSDLDGYGPEVQRILEALGHPEAWVSNLSRFSDFMFDEGELATLLQPLGLAGKVNGRTTIAEAARLLMANKSARYAGSEGLHETGFHAWAETQGFTGTEVHAAADAWLEAWNRALGVATDQPNREDGRV